MSQQNPEPKPQEAPKKEPKPKSEAQKEFERIKEEKRLKKEQDRIKELEKQNNKKAETPAPKTEEAPKQEAKPANKTKPAPATQQQKINQAQSPLAQKTQTLAVIPPATVQKQQELTKGPFVLDDLLVRRITKLKRSSKSVDPAIAHKLLLDSALEHFTSRDSILLASDHTIVKEFYERGVGEAIDLFGVSTQSTRQSNLIISRFEDAGYFMNTITKVLLSGDAIFKNGTLLTKPGTLYLVLLAHEYGVPVVALCESAKYVDDTVFPNELAEHEGTEFDLVDASYVSMLVTEAGPINPCSIPTLIAQLYP